MFGKEEERKGSLKWYASILAALPFFPPWALLISGNFVEVHGQSSCECVHLCKYIQIYTPSHTAFYPMSTGAFSWVASPSCSSGICRPYEGWHWCPQWSFFGCMGVILFPVPPLSFSCWCYWRCTQPACKAVLDEVSCCFPFTDLISRWLLISLQEAWESIESNTEGKVGRHGYHSSCQVFPKSLMSGSQLPPPSFHSRKELMWLGKWLRKGWGVGVYTWPLCQASPLIAPQEMEGCQC